MLSQVSTDSGINKASTPARSCCFEVLKNSQVLRGETRQTAYIRVLYGFCAGFVLVLYGCLPGFFLENLVLETRRFVCTLMHVLAVENDSHGLQPTEIHWGIPEHPDPPNWQGYPQQNIPDLGCPLTPLKKFNF